MKIMPKKAHFQVRPDPFLSIKKLQMTRKNPVKRNSRTSDSWTLQKKIIAAFGSGLFILLLVAAVSWGTTTKLIESANLVNHTYKVISTLNELLSSLLNVETGARGFYITQKQEYFHPFQLGVDGAESRMNELRQLISDNPEQIKRLDSLERNVKEKITTNYKRLALAKTGGTEAVAEDMKQSKIIMNDIRKGIAELMHAEQELLLKRDIEQKSMARRTIGMIIAGSVLAFALVVTASFFINRDIAGRERAEAALRESEEKNRMMIEAVKDYMILRLDSTGRILSWNLGGERITGYSSGEIIGKHFSCFYSPEDIEKRKPDFDLSAAREGKAEVEGWRVRKEGVRFWANVILTPLKDAEGRIVGYSQVTRDVTERKRASDELLKRNDMIMAANKELEAFSYSVSHDLRAPLRHIDGFVDLMQKNSSGLDDKTRRYLGIISDSAKQMGMLIDDLLVFSRMGRTEMRRGRVQLKPLFEEVIHDVAADIKNRNIEWKMAELPEVKGDSAMLRLAAVNLVSNAVKYTGPRDPARIEVGTLNGKSDETVIFVKDNGVGFDMQYADKLFGVFQRLHSSDDFEGTGIGLANVRRIISRHGGRTWAESTQGNGATFYFSLPK